MSEKAKSSKKDVKKSSMEFIQKTGNALGKSERRNFLPGIITTGVVAAVVGMLGFNVMYHTKLEKKKGGVLKTIKNVGYLERYDEDVSLALTDYEGPFWEAVPDNWKETYEKLFHMAVICFDNLMQTTVKCSKASYKPNPEDYIIAEKLLRKGIAILTHLEDFLKRTPEIRAAAMKQRKGIQGNLLGNVVHISINVNQ